MYVFITENFNWQWVALENTSLEWNGCSRPVLGWHRDKKVGVEVVDQLDELLGGMVVAKGEGYELVVDTTEGIGKV